MVSDAPDFVTGPSKPATLTEEGSWIVGTPARMVDVERIGRVGAALRQAIETSYIHGAAMRVSYRDEVIVDLIEGYADRESGRPLQRDSVFVTMSTAKPFTAVLVLSLVERGLLRLHAPVSEVLPEFGRYGKQQVNLFHLMTHTSGGLTTAPEDPEVQISIERLTAYACSTPLSLQPGEAVSYSMLVAHSVIAAMCLRVDGRGRDYATMLAEDVFRPLRMVDTSLGPRPDLLPRLCPVRFAQDVPYNVIPVQAFEQRVESVMLRAGAEVPAANCLTTIDDLHRFSEMLRKGGELDGARILSPAMIRFCARNYTGNMRNTVWDATLLARNWPAWPANIGIGFRVRGEGIQPGPFGLLNSPNTFGHFGAGSTGSWVDPENDLSFSLLTTGLLEESHNLERTAMLSDLVVSALV